MDSRYYPEVNEEEEEPEDEGKDSRWHVSLQRGLKEQVPGGSKEVDWSKLLPWEINLLNSGYCHMDRIWEAVLKQVTTHLTHTEAHVCSWEWARAMGAGKGLLYPLCGVWRPPKIWFTLQLI